MVTHPTGIGADWRLARPDQAAVRGYAGDVSVAPGDAISLHLAGHDRQAKLDVFRMGLGDARHVMTVRGVAISAQADAAPDLMTGRIEDQWPVSYSLSVGSTWKPGVYLVKLTGESGGQSYVIFLVRSPAPTALVVVLPLMTYEAYNDQGGASLYRWDGGPHARSFEVSFNRPFASQFGAGQFFWLDFPLVVWLEDHGYNPGYLTDLDIARNPRLIERAGTLLFAGHGEYWTGGIRDVVATGAAHGTNLGFFGANQAFWQVRLQSDGLGARDRTIVCYKDAALDPAAALNPAAATTRFDDPSVGRPPSGIIGTEYAGIVRGMAPVVMGPGISIFAPDIGLAPGQLLPGILAGEIDSAPESFSGGLLGASPSAVGTNSEAVTAAMAVWINPSGGRVFDAGTLGYAWGLDPRYAATLTGFPTAAFDALTARILAWLGAQPDPAVVSAVSARVSYESVAGRFATAALATRYVKRLARKHSVGYVVEHEPGRGHKPFHVVRQFPARQAAASAVRRLRKLHLSASIEADHGLGP